MLFRLKATHPLALWCVSLFVMVSLLLLTENNALALNSALPKPPPLPERKIRQFPSAQPSLREKAERELSLTPLVNKMNSKTSQLAPLQVKNLPSAGSVVAPTFTEVALTVSKITPGGTASVVASQRYDLSLVESLPVLSASVQHWFYRDFEKLQYLGFIFGTGLGEKQINVELRNRYLLTNVEILYMKFFAGLSLEKTLLDDRVHFGLNGLIVEELWQQNAANNESRWSRWVPSLALSGQLKVQVAPRWYGLVDARKYWPLAESSISTEAERIYLGVGYYL